MSVLGISAEEEETYRHFLRHPGTPADDIHLRIHTDQDTVRRCLDRLLELGLLRHEPDSGSVVPADPETAVTLLTDLRLRELYEELQRVTRSRHIVDALLAEQGPRAAAQQGVEQLGDLRRIRSRIDDLAFFARDEILSVEPYTELSPANIDHARPLDMRCLRRGVRIRSVVLRKALDHRPTRDYLRELVSHGAEVRVAEDVSERILVYDRRTALVPLDPADTSRGALLAHESGLVANIIALFDKIWDQAEDLLSVVGEDGRDREEYVPSGVERRVLDLMVSVGKDEVGARELGVSVRTYRRHVADLMRVLGAASRAQAALLARERGWI
ncbi:helix-turn-helix transcriptional regulator [Streptomyces carminius]|uniref:Helix-turn-helix transcriptional regulator n=2 Tax=Streptomyces carminius TaxID=2665496 RepID=A0A2M8LXZ6_9ACTN|nr:helix-turn-helix transcriptional regulator [Streptomyces carminius]